MRRSKGKKKAAGSQPKRTKTPRLDPLRAGMPAMDSITGVESFKKGKSVLNVIHTNEVDAYDPMPAKPKRKR
jgi:hypothetical protein